VAGPFARHKQSTGLFVSGLSLHELRHVGAGCRLGLLEEGGGVLLHQPVQRGLLGAVALVVDRCAVRCPDRRMGLRTGSLHALLVSKTWCFTVSN
jgi:hypothetical protein